MCSQSLLKNQCIPVCDTSLRLHAVSINSLNISSVPQMAPSSKCCTSLHISSDRVHSYGCHNDEHVRHAANVL